MEQLSRLSSDSLRRFLADHYTGSRMILAASGVEHSKLVDLVKPMLEKVCSRNM
jgi:processing peptidase subunit alpha